VAWMHAFKYFLFRFPSGAIHVIILSIMY
jgi:hypothetical protein